MVDIFGIWLIVDVFHLEQLYDAHVNPREAYQQKMKKMCSQLTLMTEEQSMSYELFFLSDKGQYVFCCNPKVACTSWRYVLLKLTGKYLFNYAPSLQLSDKFINRGVHYGPAQRQMLLKKYYTFMFVREPLERIVSAYLNKCVHHMYKSCTPAAMKISSSNTTRQGETTKYLQCACDDVEGDSDSLSILREL